MLYAQSLHEFMMSNKSLTFDEVTSNGAEIINRILKRRYASIYIEAFNFCSLIFLICEGIQGFDMQIDENGDALGNYTLLSLQPISPMTNKSNPEYYPLDIALYPTADFVMSGDPSALPQLRFQRKINWIGGTPPVDEPACGFFEEKCGSNNVGLAMLIIFPLILVLAPILIFLYVRHRLICSALFHCNFFFYLRNLKFEKELSNIWLIDPQEVGKIARCDGSSSTLFVVEVHFH
jgi:hypothetical protein